MRWDNNAIDASSITHLFNGDGCLLAKHVTVMTDRSTVLDVVAAIRPKPTLENVMCIHGFVATKHALPVVALEDCFAKLVARKKFGFHGEL